MFFRFLAVYIFSFAFVCCTYQDLKYQPELKEAINYPKTEQRKLLCKINHETGIFTRSIPETDGSKLAIQRIIVRNRTASVTVNVFGKAQGQLFFEACQLTPLGGGTSKNCQPVNVVDDSESWTSHHVTKAGKHHLHLKLLDQTSCKMCLLRVTYTRVTNEHKNSVTDTKDVLTVCGMFAVRSGRSKRQAETCQGFGEYIDLPGIDDWCKVNCAVGYCPSTHCTCENQAYPAGDDYENEDDDLYVQFLSRNQ